MKTRRRPPTGKERGTLIIALMAGITIVMILSTVAVQNWADVVRRDNEAEMMFRAQDIVRALKRYQTEKGQLPTELKMLMEPGNKGQYFLRHLWKDPLVKGGQWQLVYAAPGGGLFDPSLQPPPPQGATGGLQSPTLGAPPGAPPAETVAFPPIGGSSAADAKGGITGDPAGFPIAGVKSKCGDKAFRKYKEKTEYSEWVFSIFDFEQRQPTAAQTGAQNPSPTFPPQGGAPPPDSAPIQEPPPAAGSGK